MRFTGNIQEFLAKPRSGSLHLTRNEYSTVAGSAAAGDGGGGRANAAGVRPPPILPPAGKRQPGLEKDRVSTYVQEPTATLLFY